jgi:hypothetical protein
MFRPYGAIIRYPRYAKLFTVMLVSILKFRSRKDIETVFTKFNRATYFNLNFNRFLGRSATGVISGYAHSKISPFVSVFLY